MVTIVPSSLKLYPESTSQYDGEAKIFRWVIQYMTRRRAHMPQNLDELLWRRNQVPTHTLTYMPTHTPTHTVLSFDSLHSQHASIYE